MSNLFLYIGMTFLVIGIVIIMAVVFLGKGEAKTEGAVVGFIGPIPIGFATSKGMLYLVLGLSITMVVTYLLMRR